MKKFNDLKRDIDASRNLAEDVLKEVLKRAKQYKQFDFLFVQFNVRCGFVLVEDYGFGHWQAKDLSDLFRQQAEEIGMMDEKDRNQRDPARAPASDPDLDPQITEVRGRLEMATCQRQINIWNLLVSVLALFVIVLSTALIE